MCGICGIFHYEDSRPADRSVVESMNDMITHRGPDEEGLHLDGPVGLAMRRLIIIDPETGQQPLYNEDKTVVCVFNGEIYNFQGLRNQLTDRGHTLASRGDGEVIVHLYEEFGAECLDKLRGMFAFALWDARKELLLIARDRLGIKPLYYADVDGALVFGSEQKAILRSGMRREVDTEGLHHYLSLNYMPAPFSAVKGVRQLGPGEYLVCDKQGARTRSYWDLHFVPDEAFGEEEWARRVHDKLRECVDTHLVSDVPFGAFLSGGIDSSAVVGFMAELLNDPVSTFSIDFTQKTYSEAAHARTIADRFATDHHEFTVTPDVADMLDVLVWHADDPLADSSMLPVYMLSKLAREHVKMVLTGDGGDEVFAGYPTYNAYYVRNNYRRLPQWMRKGVITPLVRAMPVSLTKVSFDYKAKRFVHGAELDWQAAHYWWRAIFSEEMKEALYAAANDRAHIPPTVDLYRRSFDASHSDDPLSQMLYVDTRLYLPSDMLAKVDRMAMANALEARVPFLDHELVELAAAIPSPIKFKDRRNKHILKEALRGMIPDGILDRRKAGFNVPINTWLTGELQGFARTVLDPDRVRAANLFDPAYVTRLLDEHSARDADHNYAIFGLICFQLWYERFIGSEVVEPPRSVAERWSIPSAAV